MPYMDKYELAWRHKQGASIGVLAQLNGCKPKAILTEMEKTGEAPLTLEDKLELDHFGLVGKERAMVQVVWILIQDKDDAREGD